MTRVRRRKKGIRPAACGRGYTSARHQALPPAGLGIADHEAEIYICGACEQPAYASATDLTHCTEQEGSVYCPAFPTLPTWLRMDWHESLALDAVRDLYPWPSSEIGVR
ncbi:hypothetical protein ACFW5I_34330 [Streptomyces sp. NPDC058818]|uniref:hypothetical protein n=1 Tax=Streptomyces sp. NPDC058818 TaxID=3346640 RepID=UPI00369AD84F